jgi:hypothetical protein
MDENTIWDIRALVYSHFIETTRPPSVAETASHFGLTQEEAASAYETLAQHHMLFLSPGTHDIAMAWPFSGVETPFKVHANGKTYFANCAWDSFGIPAALHVDAEIEAEYAQTGEKLNLTVRNQQARAERSRSVHGDDTLVHLLVPFREWYDDLSFT